MSLRLRYVIEQGWLTSISTDDDVYDISPDTAYFIRTDGTPARWEPARVAAGMRITRVPSFRESLTWSMLAATPAAQRTIEREHAALLADVDRRAASPGHGLWDLTRLVSLTDGSLPAPTIIQSVYELFGMALYKTVVEPGTDPVWMCLTTHTVERLFTMSGFECTVLFRGRVSSSDDYDCVLCLINPRAVYDAIGRSDQLAHRRAYKNILSGYEALQPVILPRTGT